MRLLLRVNMSCLQIVQLVLLRMLPEEGSSGPDHLGGETVHHPTVPGQSDQEPEVQHIHLPPPPVMEPVQILSQFILPRYGL